VVTSGERVVGLLSPVDVTRRVELVGWGVAPRDGA